MSNTANVTRWVGLEETRAAMRALPEDMRTRTLATGMKALLQPIKRAAKQYARASDDTGALRESITDKVVNYPANGKCVGLVGPDKAYFAHGRKLNSSVTIALAGKARRKPANYAHLIEFGHLAVAPRKGTSIRKKTATRVGFVAARPFLRPAVATTTAEQSAAFAAGLDRGFNAAVSREVKAGRHIR